MADIKFKLTGGQAAIGIVLLLAFFGYRISTIGNDMRTDEDLMMKVEQEIMSEYLPNELEKVKKAIEKVGEEAMFDRVGELGTTKIDIQELKISYPFYVFSIGSKEGVVKVKFVLSDDNGVIKDGINFYRFEYHPIGGIWYLPRKSSKYDYMMKFVL